MEGKRTIVFKLGKTRFSQNIPYARLFSHRRSHITTSSSLDVFLISLVWPKDLSVSSDYTTVHTCTCGSPKVELHYSYPALTLNSHLLVNDVEVLATVSELRLACSVLKWVELCGRRGVSDCQS